MTVEVEKKKKIRKEILNMPEGLESDDGLLQIIIAAIIVVFPAGMGFAKSFDVGPLQIEFFCSFAF